VLKILNHENHEGHEMEESVCNLQNVMWLNSFVPFVVSQF